MPAVKVPAFVAAIAGANAGITSDAGRVFGAGGTATGVSPALASAE